MVVEYFLVFASISALYGVGVHAIESCDIHHNSDMAGMITDSWMYRELSLRDPVSPIECAVRCVQDPSCVTFMVNVNTKRCRLHAASISMLNAPRAESGFFTYDTCRARQAFGAVCSRDDQCTLQDSVCVEDMCQCLAGYSYSPDTLTCVTDCTNYGDEFTAFHRWFISANNIASFYDNSSISRTGCSQACVDYTDDICRSADLDLDRPVCRLANITAHDLPDAYMNISYYNVYYMQRHCAHSYTKTLLDNSAIASHDMA